MIPAALLLGLALPARAEPFLDAVGAYEEKNYYAAARLLQQSADEGNDYAQAYLAEMYYNGEGVSSDTAKALALTQASVRAGNVLGHYDLGIHYQDGTGVPQNSYDAAREFSIAADAGLPAAQVNLGVADYEIDKPSKAVKLWKENIDSRVSRIALQDLTAAYWRGKGVRADVKEARRMLAKTGDSEALSTFDKYSSQKDEWSQLPPNLWACAGGAMPVGRDAYDLIKKDAKGLHPAALYLLGAMYEDGVDAPHDKELAAKYYKKALEYGYAAAKARLDALGIKPEEPKAAQPAPVAKISSDVDAPKFKLAERPDDFALVIGVEKYKSIPEAKYALRDAQAFRAHALALGIPERNLITLTGADATRTKIQAYLEEWLPKNVKADSTLFVYYSGHGAPDAETHQAFLLPWDADPEFLQSTGYPLTQLYGSLGKLKAKTIVVALDSCFSGAGGRSVLAPGLRPLVTRIDPVEDTGRLTVLAAAAGDQVTGSLDDQGHGMFTYYLLKGIDEAAKDGSAVVTARELYASVKGHVQDDSARQNRLQTPQLAGPDAVLATLK